MQLPDFATCTAKIHLPQWHYTAVYVLHATAYRSVSSLIKSSFFRTNWRRMSSSSLKVFCANEGKKTKKGRYNYKINLIRFPYKILHQTSRGLEQSWHLPSVFPHLEQGKQLVASVLYLAHEGCFQSTPKQRGHPGVVHCTFYQIWLFSWWKKNRNSEKLPEPKCNSLPLLSKAHGLVTNFCKQIMFCEHS